MNKLGTRIIGVGLLAIAAVTFSVSTSQAFSLRVPQITFGSPLLQAILNSRDGGIHVLTDQLDAQAFTTNFTGTTDFYIAIQTSAGNEIGVYDGAAVGAPTLYQIFPPAAVQGWYAACHFDASGGLFVALYDQTNTFQGSTSYVGVTRTNFGFYISGGCGTFYSQDVRNPGNHAQVLTYLGTGTNFGDWFECFESCPYSPTASTFTSDILVLQSVAPTPTKAHTWGALKSSYR